MILMDLRECWFTRQCGERCPAQQIVMAGGSFNRSLPKTSCFNATLGARHSLDAGDEPFFTWGPVMDHAETVLQPCLEPYSSLVFLFRVLKNEWQFPMEFHTLLQFISVYHCLSQVSKDIDIIIYTHMIIYHVYICSGLNPIRTNSKQCGWKDLGNHCLTAIQGMCFSRWSLKPRQLYQLDLLLGLHRAYEWFQILYILLLFCIAQKIGIEKLWQGLELSNNL